MVMGTSPPRNNNAPVSYIEDTPTLKSRKKKAGTEADDAEDIPLV